MVFLYTSFYTMHCVKGIANCRLPIANGAELEAQSTARASAIRAKVQFVNRQSKIFNRKLLVPLLRS